MLQNIKRFFLKKGDLAIVAGSDTTSNTITNFLCFLMDNPIANKRLQAEKSMDWGITSWILPYKYNFHTSVLLCRSYFLIESFVFFSKNAL